MKEIKFRAVKQVNGGWQYGHYCYDKQSDQHFIFTDDIEIGFEVNPNTLGQYTGLKDKNGREIYEGDVIEFTDKWEWYRGSWFAKFAFADAERKKELQKEFDALPTEKRAVVIDISEGINFSVSDLKEGRWQVIGNIYENPELIK